MFSHAKNILRFFFSKQLLDVSIKSKMVIWKQQNSRKCCVNAGKKGILHIKNLKATWIMLSKWNSIKAFFCLPVLCFIFLKNFFHCLEFLPSLVFWTARYTDFGINGWQCICGPTQEITDHTKPDSRKKQVTQICQRPVPLEHDRNSTILGRSLIIAELTFTVLCPCSCVWECVTVGAFLLTCISFGGFYPLFSYLITFGIYLKNTQLHKINVAWSRMCFRLMYSSDCGECVLS